MQFWLKDAYYYLGENHQTECFFRDKETEIVSFIRHILQACIAYRIPPEKFLPLLEKLYHNEEQFWKGFLKEDPELF